MSGSKSEKSTGNPVARPDGQSWTEARLSPPIQAGHASPSSGDHGAAAGADPMNPVGPRMAAYMHPDMRSGTTSVVPGATIRTERDMFPRDLRGIPGVQIALDRLDAYDAAGAPDLRAQPSGMPVRPLPHIAQGGTSNGGHSLGNPASHAVANKDQGPLRGSAAVEAMRTYQRRMDGRR